MVALEEVSPWPPRISDGSTRWKLPRSCSKRIETSPADVHSRTGVATVGMPASYLLDAFGKLVPHPQCQRIGQQAKARRLRGARCRSARAPDGAGRELAWFPSDRSEQSTAKDDSAVRNVVLELGARARITSHSWMPMHPAWLRCKSFIYLDMFRALRLARRAPFIKLNGAQEREFILARTLRAHQSSTLFTV